MKRKKSKQKISKKKIERSYGALLLIPIGIVLFASIALLIGFIYFKHTEPVVTIALPVTNSNPHELTEAEYNQLVVSLSEIVTKNDPRAALGKLSDLSNTNPKILRSCHALAHEIGHAAYKKYNDFAKALDYQDDLCGSGYLHGVIEEYFKSSKNLFSVMQNVCNEYGFIDAGKCYHGVGHGIMYYTGNNVPLSIFDCNSYSTIDARIHCSEGVFMENFNSDERFHPSKYLNAQNPFYPCNIQTTFYKDSCYFYAPDYYLHLHDEQYEDAVKWCDSAEEGFILKCLNGLGSRIMKQNLANPHLVEELCMKADTPEKTAYCIDGMVSYYLVNYNSISKAENLCGTLELSNRQSCYAAVGKRNMLFIN